MKRSKEEADIIKSLAKDEFNPFLINGQGGIKISHEYSEKIPRKMLSRIIGLSNEDHFDAKGTMEKLKNEDTNSRCDVNIECTPSSKYDKGLSPPESNEGLPLPPNPLETKEEFKSPVMRKIPRTKDAKKDYKSSLFNPK